MGSSGGRLVHAEALDRNTTVGLGEACEIQDGLPECVGGLDCIQYTTETCNQYYCTNYSSSQYVSAACCPWPLRCA